MEHFWNNAANLLKRAVQILLVEEDLGRCLLQQEAGAAPLRGGKVSAPSRRKATCLVLDAVEEPGVAWQAQRRECRAQGKQQRLSVRVDAVARAENVRGKAVERDQAKIP